MPRGVLRRALFWTAAVLAITGCSAVGRTQEVSHVDVVSAPAVVIGPSLPAEKPAAKPAPDLAKLRKDLQAYLNEQDGTYGVYIVDLPSGKGVGINADKPFPAASTFKLPMSLYILDQVAKGKASLDEQIAYEEEDYEDGTGTLQDTISVGDAYTVRDLIELAIKQSDNIATHMLLRRFGAENVYEYMRRLGGKVTEYEEGVVGTTPRDMAIYMRDAQANNIIKDAKLRQLLLRSLEHTAFEDRTAAGVPDGVAVAHKIGTLPNVVNDVALVEAPGHPFIIAAFSVDVDDEVAPTVITEVTRKVYEFLVAS